MDRDVVIKDIGIGLREWTFEHVDTQCRFVLTKSPAFLNLVGLVTFPLLYRRLTKTSGGESSASRLSGPEIINGLCIWPRVSIAS